MAGRYVPPHLRNKLTAAPEAEASNALPNSSLPPSRPLYDDPKLSDLYTLQEIHTYFWKRHETLDSNHNTTLHSSADNPNGLAWILLFKDANPKWESDGIIFVKSNLGILPAIRSSCTGGGNSETEQTGTQAKRDIVEPGTDLRHSIKSVYKEDDERIDSKAKENMSSIPRPKTSSEGIPVAHAPIAVFSQTVRVPGRCFKFPGWYRITCLELLEPHSEGLVRMLAKKWETVDRFGHVHQRRRNAKGWEESMTYKWAVIKMEKDEQAAKEKGKPQIEKIDDEEGGVILDPDERGKKSVNEMLAELRLKDGK